MGTFPSIWPAISRIGYCSSGNLAIKEFTLGILVNLPILANFVNLANIPPRPEALTAIYWLGYLSKVCVSNLSKNEPKKMRIYDISRSVTKVHNLSFKSVDKNNLHKPLCQKGSQ